MPLPNFIPGVDWGIAFSIRLWNLWKLLANVTYTSN